VDLLTKPFTQAALGEKLRDILDAATQHLRRLFQDVESVSFLAKPYTEEVLRAALRAVGIR
jgi:hypothetical protein